MTCEHVHVGFGSSYGTKMETRVSARETTRIVIPVAD